MKKRAYMWSGVLLAALLLLSTVLTGCTTSSESIAPAPNAAVSLVAASSAPSGAPQEGIKVHGHWTIEVRNPDGTMVERREFENALLNTGSMGLARVLGRADSVGGWWVVLWAINPVDHAFFSQLDSTPAPAGITETTFGGAVVDTNIFRTLTLALPTSGANANKLVLSGTATAQRNGKIEYVTTDFEILPPTQPPSSQYGDNGRSFTETVLANPVNLSAGQQVMVTVVISFS